MSQTSAAILTCLDGAPAPMTVHEIALTAGLHPPTVQNTLRQLEESRAVAVVGSLSLCGRRHANLWSMLPLEVNR
jgi:DNA-binding IclR family transcriptional regulator